MAAENEALRREIRYARESAEITADLVVKQFEETERLLSQFQEANSQRKAVLDSALQVAIISSNNQGKITLFNKGAERMLGYTAKEVIGKHTPEIFHEPLELQRRCRHLRDVNGKSIEGIQLFFYYAAQRTPRQTEWVYVRKDGTTLSVNMSINALRDAEGSMIGFLCMATDITEKKRSERALKESERNYRQLVSSIPNIVFKGYADGSIEFFDDKIEKLTGYAKEEFNTRKINWFDIVVDEDRPAIKEKFIHALRSDRSYIRHYRIRKKNGENLWIEAGSQIICDEKGRIKFITGAFLDISERKSAEKALHESEAKYRSLFDSGPNPIFVLDRTTLEILDANPSAEETYGYSKDELLGRAFTDLGSLEDETRAESLLENENWPEACIVSQRARHRKRDGEQLFIKMKICPIRYRDRDAVILAVTDITDSVEKDAQLFQASKMTTLGELSAGVAHELNQPLNAIKIGSEYLKRMAQDRKMPPLDDLMEASSAISEQVDRASEIIRRLRNFGRKPDFEKTRVPINTAIRNVAGIIGQQLSLQGIDLDLDLDPSEPEILANGNLLEQVVFNVVTNARDAIEQRAHESDAGLDRSIRIQSFLNADAAGFIVSDDGIGIPEDNKEKIFEPFFTTKEVGKGVGLGLSIIYGIVRDFGGTIDMKSELGEGTEITFTFPNVL